MELILSHAVQYFVINSWESALDVSKWWFDKNKRMFIDWRDLPMNYKDAKAQREWLIHQGIVPTDPIEEYRIIRKFADLHFGENRALDVHKNSKKEYVVAVRELADREGRYGELVKYYNDFFVSYMNDWAKTYEIDHVIERLSLEEEKCHFVERWEELTNHGSFE